MMNALKTSEKWAEIIPKIFEAVKNECSTTLQGLHADCTECDSEGKLFPCALLYMYTPYQQNLDPFWQA